MARPFTTVFQIPGNIDHHDAPVAAHQQHHLQQIGAPVVQQASHQCRTTSSGTSTQTLQVSLSRSTAST
jgi:hypothetical protein